MERNLELDNQPPYVEVYQHAPLMYLRICDFDAACHSLPPKQWVCWCHDVQCQIERIAAAVGIYKIKAMSQGSSCIFSISPDMPPREQAALMLASAQRMMQELRQITTPFGGQLSLQITMHAGEFAGGVVGTSAWTYDLYGEHVSAVQALDEYNQPNQIQVSEAALRLLPDAAAFEPWYLLTGMKHETVSRVYRLLSDEQGNATSAGAQQEQQQQSQTGTSAVAECYTQAAASAGGSAQGQQRDDLSFANPLLESAYRRAHDAGMARLDILFASMWLLLAASCMWGLWANRRAPLAGDSSEGGSTWVSPLLGALFCALPLVGVAMGALAPAWYVERREQLWAWHRVLAVVSLCGAYCFAYRTEWPNCAALPRLSGLVMLVNALGFKVRYKLHCLLTTVNVATCAAAVAYLVSAGSMMPSPGVLLMSATMAVCLPVLLVYNWERDHRRQFLARLGERAVPPAVAAARAKAKAA